MVVPFTPYPNYRASSFDHLGEIPSHWVTRRLKSMAKIRNGQDYKHVEVDDGYPVMGSGGRFSWAKTYMYNRPSVLLGRKGTIDKPLYVDYPFWTVDTMYYTEVGNLIPPKYLYYLATTIQFHKYSTATALPSMTQEHLGNYVFSTPPSTMEMEKIARFLDHETGRFQGRS